MSKVKDLWSYINSWEFWISFMLSVGLIGLMHIKFINVEPMTIAAETSLFIPILGIFFTVSSLSITVLVSSLPKKFGRFLEERCEGAYSKLISIHVWGICVYLITIFSWVLCGFLARCHLSNIVLIIYYFTIFMTIYSFFYTAEIIRHFIKIIRTKVEFDQITRIPPNL